MSRLKLTEPTVYRATGSIPIPWFWGGNWREPTTPVTASPQIALYGEIVCFLPNKSSAVRRGSFQYPQRAWASPDVTTFHQINPHIETTGDTFILQSTLQQRPLSRQRQISIPDSRLTPVIMFDIGNLQNEEVEVLEDKFWRQETLRMPTALIGNGVDQKTQSKLLERKPPNMTYGVQGMNNLVKSASRQSMRKKLLELHTRAQ